MKLPIDDVLPDLLRTLEQHSNAVLVAEPGAGKTTKVPTALLDAPWLHGAKVLLLEPRRVAARSAVRFIASERGEQVGDRIGYRIRGESRVGPRTQLEVVTEGILTRIIQSQPELEGIGAIVFDEFHERSLHADLGLALALEVQRLIRPDLRLLVMSATLDAEAVAMLMGGATVISCPGRTHPIELRYRPLEPRVPLEHGLRSVVRSALSADQGDILVFLPGRGEIRRTQAALEELDTDRTLQILPLYSDLPTAQLEVALAPARPGARKIILATSIAETSLTIPGVRVVVDCGLTRAPRFDVRRAMSTLVTVPVSQATAAQRAGRAGREAPGVCYRLWSEERQRTLPPFHEPEMLHIDLASLALELALWGSPEPSRYAFLTPPPPAAYSQALALLRMLGAIDESSNITDHGRAMSRLGVHPRIAHMLLVAQQLGCGAIACDLAALFEDRGSAFHGADVHELSSRWRALGQKKRADGALERIRQEAQRLRELLGIRERGAAADDSIAKLTALAYPERIAQQRAPNSRRYLLRNGSGAELPSDSPLFNARYLAVAQLEGGAENARIHLAESIAESDLYHLFETQLARRVETVWSEADEAVRAREIVQLGALILETRTVPPSPEQALAAMLSGIRSRGVKMLPWSNDTRAFVQRSEWLRANRFVDGGWPDLSDETLIDTLEQWLGPFLTEISSRQQLAKLDLLPALHGLFSWQQRQRLDTLAPSHLDLPSGSKAALRYEPGRPPTLAVRLQEMFGQRETPTVADGRVAVTLELLSPARRPLQVTQDLESFWRNGYLQVRKEMQGRYPKHHWPEDPLSAAPTFGAKRRRK